MSWRVWLQREASRCALPSALECPGESGVLRGSDAAPQQELFELAVCGPLCAELGVSQGHKDESGFCLSGGRHRVRWVWGLFFPFRNRKLPGLETWGWYRHFRAAFVQGGRINLNNGECIWAEAVRSSSKGRFACGGVSELSSLGWKIIASRVNGCGCKWEEEQVSKEGRDPEVWDQRGSGTRAVACLS